MDLSTIGEKESLNLQSCESLKAKMDLVKTLSRVLNQNRSLPPKCATSLATVEFDDPSRGRWAILHRCELQRPSIWNQHRKSGSRRLGQLTNRYISCSLGHSECVYFHRIEHSGESRYGCEHESALITGPGSGGQRFSHVQCLLPR